MKFKIILKDEYLSNKDKYLNDISVLYLNDDCKLANIDDISKIDSRIFIPPLPIKI